MCLTIQMIIKEKAHIFQQRGRTGPWRFDPDHRFNGFFLGFAKGPFIKKKSKNKGVVKFLAMNLRFFVIKMQFHSLRLG